MEETLGEKRVKIDFNITHDTTVYKIKKKTAELINLLEGLKNDEVSKTYNATKDVLKDTSGEKLRLISLAQTNYELAGMWAVKSIFTE